MPSSDLKIRYSIAIVTALLFLLAVSSSFGQNSVRKEGVNDKAIVQQIEQSDPLIDPLSPSILNSEKTMASDNSGTIQYDDGRIVQIDGQVVQSFSIPRKDTSIPEKNKSDLNRKD